MPGNDRFTTLLLHCDGVTDSTIVTDTAVAGHRLNGTVFGSAAISTAKSVFGTGSLFLDGDNDYLTYSASAVTGTSTAVFVFGTGDFTVDCWVMPAVTASSTTDWSIAAGLGPIDGSWMFAVPTHSTYAAPPLGFGQNQDSWDLVTSSLTWTADQWYHVAAVRSGSTLMLYRDGVQLATGNSTFVYRMMGNPELAIGARQFLTGSSAAGNFFHGWINEVRVSNGIARWTSTGFTPPSQPYDALQSNGIDNYTILLLHCSGTNGSQTFGDSSPSLRGLATVGGNAQVSTAKSKFGATSLALDGTGDYLEFSNNPDWNLGENYTVEAWVYLNALPAAGLGAMICTRIGGTGLNDWAVFIDENGYVGAHQYIGSTLYYVYADQQVTLGTWNHVAFVRSAGINTIYLNGVAGPVPLAVGISPDNGGPLQIGAYATGFHFLNGYIDELRISNTARWTSNFSPPTAPYGIHRYDSTLDRAPFAVGTPPEFTLVSSLDGGLSVVEKSSPKVTNRVVECNPAITFAANYVWTFPSSAGNYDSDALALVKISNIAFAGPAAVMTVRLLSSVYPTNGYIIRPVPSGSSGGGSFQLNVVDMAGAVTLTSCASFTWVADAWYWCRLRAISSNISGSMWALNSTEPATPMATLTSTTATNGGFSLRFQPTTSFIVSNAWFSAAVNGDIAPGPSYAAAQITTRSNDDIGILPDAMKGY